MANVDFPDYMKGVSGTLSTITLKDGTKRRTIVTCSKSGKQRLYIRDYKPRTDKVSKKEMAARSLFKRRQALVRELMEAHKFRTLKEAWDFVRQEITK